MTQRLADVMAEAELAVPDSICDADAHEDDDNFGASSEEEWRVSDLLSGGSFFEPEEFFTGTPQVPFWLTYVACLHIQF